MTGARGSASSNDALLYLAILRRFFPKLVRLKILNKRSVVRVSALVSISCALCLMLLACGKNYYIAGRTLPPSGILNRVMYAEQTPNMLPFVDGYYDVRHNIGDTIPQFSISGFNGSLPVTIQNMPAQQAGAVYNAGNGTLSLIDYSKEKFSASVTIPGGLSNSVFITHDMNYVYAANDANHVLSVVNRLTGGSYVLNLPGVYGISVNPAGTVVLAFVHNSTQAANQSTAGGTPNNGFAVYSVVELTQAQSQAAAYQPNFTFDVNGQKTTAEDCEPQNLPAYCVVPVSTGSNATFDHPIKAVFSSNTAYVVDCGPECGGTAAAITAIPITANALNVASGGGSVGASGLFLQATSTTPIPNGVTDALINGNTLYLAGQKCVGTYTSGAGCSSLFTGYLTTVDVSNSTKPNVTGTYPIGDGDHDKMLLADDNTLWIGANDCNQGVRYSEALAGQNTNYGCLTMINLGNDQATIDSYKGDATGIADVTNFHKVYTAEGGQVYIYSTKDMSQLDNTNVTVAGTVTDVAYMDGETDANNTNY